jgi:hypothetical protein
MSLYHRLHEAAATGEVLDLGSQNRRREVPAAVIRSLLSASDAAALCRLHLRGADIEGPCELAGIAVPFPVFFDHCDFDSEINLREAEFPALNLSGCIAHGPLNATGLAVRGALTLNGGFHAHSTVVLDRARVGGLVDCSGSQFDGESGIALSGVSIVITGDLFCCNKFVARGEVRFPKAQIGGEFNCTAGCFYNYGETALFADNIRVAGRIACGPGFVTRGAVDMRRAEVGSQLRFEGTSIAPGKIAWNLEAARIVRAAVLTPEAAVSGDVNLTNATFGYLRDNDDFWNDGYELSGLVFGSLVSSSEQAEHEEESEGAGRRARPGEAPWDLRWWRPSPAVAKRLSWLRDNASGYQPQLYDQLAEDYRRVGHERSQRCVLIEKQRRRREKLPFAGRVWSKIEELLLGYGYRSWQAFFPIVALLIVGSCFFALVPNDVRPTHHEPRPPLWPALYTVDILLPIINISQREYFVTRHFGAVLATSLTIASWFLLTAIIAGFTGFVRRAR